LVSSKMIWGGREARGGCGRGTRTVRLAFSTERKGGIICCEPWKGWGVPLWTKQQAAWGRNGGEQNLSVFKRARGGSEKREKKNSNGPNL